jgi:hypothetical protein
MKLNVKFAKFKLNLKCEMLEIKAMWKKQLQCSLVCNVCYNNMNCFQIKNQVDYNGAVLKMIDYMPKQCVCIQHLKQLLPMNCFGSSMTKS